MENKCLKRIRKILLIVGLRSHNICHYGNKIIQAKQITIFMIAQCPRAVMVDLDLFRNGHRFSKINHPNTGPIRSVNQ